MEENEFNQDSGRTSYKTLYEESLEEIKILKEEKTSLSERLSEQSDEVSSLSSEITDLEETISSNDKEIETLNSTVKEKNRIIRENELRRFASAYASQENEYGQQRETWFGYSLVATILLTLSVVFSIAAPYRGWVEGSWYQQPGFYLLNAIFLTLFVYSLKQHAYFGRLKVDYANRKTLAQSYQHVIEDEEDAKIQNGFLQEIVKVFAAVPNHSKESVTIWEWLLKKRQDSQN